MDFVHAIHLGSSEMLSSMLSSASPSSLDSLFNFSRISRSWILYHRPSVSSTSSSTLSSSALAAPTHSHAGFLLALGLSGHLANLTPADLISYVFQNLYFFLISAQVLVIFNAHLRYLSQKHLPTALSILLGLAAAKRGSQDATVSRMLSVHLPALPPLASLNIEVPMLIQTAALTGIGLLYQGLPQKLPSVSYPASSLFTHVHYNACIHSHSYDCCTLGLLVLIRLWSPLHGAHPPARALASALLRQADRTRGGCHCGWTRTGHALLGQRCLPRIRLHDDCS
jgi:hypothetical protein